VIFDLPSSFMISVFLVIKFKVAGNNVNVIYAISRSNAAMGNIDKALYLLEQAIKKDRKTIKKWAIDDEFFDSLLDEPKFRKLVK